MQVRLLQPFRAAAAELEGIPEQARVGEDARHDERDKHRARGADQDKADVLGQVQVDM